MTSAPPLRPYQARAAADVTRLWADGTRRVCLVLPTGGGKTRVAVELAQSVPAHMHEGRAARVLWVAHRTELIGQAAAKLREAGADVGMISPQHPPDPWATTQVGSIDTLLARDMRPAADLLIWDECHHAAAKTYSSLLTAYPDTVHLGLTATPQRRDGKPLGEHYDRLVVGAQYSELIASGALVQCRVRRAPRYLGSDLARPPLAEWQEHGEDRLTFAFAPSVAQAKAWTQDFLDAGIQAACVHGSMRADDRDRVLQRFRDGEIRVLWNVYVLTEGVDVPQASCLLLARGCGHAGTYLQMAGRVLRPAPGKAHALMLDMAGASWIHDLPTCDREYALEGRSISAVGQALKNCPQCASIVSSPTTVCPDCGYVWEQSEADGRTPKIWDMELQWAINTSGGIDAVPDEAKHSEWRRLAQLAVERNWSVRFAINEYVKVFGEQPRDEWKAELPTGIKVQSLVDLMRIVRDKGYKDGWARYRFKARFGHMPTGGELEDARGRLKAEEVASD